MKPRAKMVVYTGLICAVQVLLPPLDAVRGEVVALRSQTMSRVVEMTDGEAGSSDSSSEDFPVTSSRLPIESFSGLGNFEGEAESLFGGRGISTFRDPALSLLANPGELGVEADCFSLDSSVSYEVVSEVLETRDIVFSHAELGVSALATSGPALRALGAATESGASETTPDDVEVLGSMFVNGGVLIWSTDPARDLSGLQVELSVTIDQIGGSSKTAGTNLFSGGVLVNGAAGGEIAVTSSGGIAPIVDGPALLLASNLIGVGGVVGQLNAIGRVHLVVLPGQMIPYTYAARPSDPFSLEVQATCRVTNLPDGTGVAAVFGRPFRSLVTSVAPVISPKSAELAQLAMNRTIAEAAAVDSSAETRHVGCGAIGFCMPLVIFCGLGTFRRRTGRVQKAGLSRLYAL